MKVSLKIKQGKEWTDGDQLYNSQPGADPRDEVSVQLTPQIITKFIIRKL